MEYYHYIGYSILLLITPLITGMIKDYIEVSYLHKRKQD